MNKTIVAMLCIALMLICVGCGGNIEPSNTEQEPTQTSDDSIDAADTSADEEATTTAFENEIAEAFETGKEVRCTMKVEGVTQEMWIKNEKQMRIESDVQGQKANMIYNNDVVYSWVEGQSEGMMFNIKEMEDMAKEYEDQGEMETPKSPENIADIAVDIDCEETNIPDSLFQKPSGIAFKDFTEMMNQMMEQMEAMQTQMPEGIEIPQ